jgi:hypothetical protein
VVLTREEKERHVLELHNRRTRIGDIAKEVRMSFRDIGFIVDRAEREKEAKEGQARHSFLSSQAYRLFSEGRTPVEVAIELNIREPDVTQYYKEYWKLKNLDNLYRIYREIGNDIWYFVELFRLAKIAGMRVKQVIKVLTIANNYLPWVEDRHNCLTGEVDLLEAKKESSARIIQDYDTQIAALGKRFADTCLACQEEGDNLLAFQQKRAKLEAFVRNFENNDPGYIKISNAIEEKAGAKFSNLKDILRIAVLSVTESIRNNPDKYSALIRSKIPSTLDCNNYQYPTYYGFYMGRQPQQKLSKEEYADMLVEEADKLYYKLVKELVGQTINDYRPPNQTSSIPQSNYDLSSNRSGDRADIYHNPTPEL